MKTLCTGLSYTIEHQVTKNDTAKIFKSGDLEILATPKLISLMEEASVFAIDNCLFKENTTVGISIDMKHIKATPIGVNTKIIATLTEINNKKLIFNIEAFDDYEKISTAIHERYIINTIEFMTKTNNKVIGHINK